VPDPVYVSRFVVVLLKAKGAAILTPVKE